MSSVRAIRIGVWISLLACGLVVLVAGALGPGGLVLLRRFAEDAARSKVQLAALAALNGIERAAVEAETGARLLSERPTLRALLEAREPAPLADFLERFRAAGALAGCAIVADGRVLAAAPASLPWERIAASAPEGRGYVASERANEAHFAVARATLAAARGEQALAVALVDAELARRLAQQVGLPVEIEFSSEASRSTPVLEGEHWSAWAATSAPAGEHAIGARVRLPVEEVAASLRPHRRAFVIVALVASLAAATAGTLAARRLSRPLAALRAAAERIGAGDLATPVPAAAGVEAGALAATMEDMRRRLRAAGSIVREREAEAKALLEGIVEGVYAVDGERRIQYVNAQAARLLGMEPDQIVGRFCGDVLRPALRDGVRPCDQSCPIVHARSRGSTRALEQVELASGRRRLVVTSAPPVGTRQVQLLRDETEIEAARRSRDAVLADLSHELKTPLAAQLASIELLHDALAEQEPRPSGAVFELAGSLQRSALRLTRLLDNLIESVRIETGRGGSLRVPVDLAAVAHEAAAMIEPLLRQRKQSLEIDLPDALEPVRGDPVQLAQVLVNLLANAHKFGPDGSAIRIGGAQRDGRCSIWVDDAGPGVPASDASSVFDRYHRADPGAADGTGLGLWIVKSIVERHDGRVVLGLSPLGGSRFTVSLPAGGFA